MGMTSVCVWDRKGEGVNAANDVQGNELYCDGCLIALAVIKVFLFS